MSLGVLALDCHIATEIKYEPGNNLHVNIIELASIIQISIPTRSG